MIQPKFIYFNCPPSPYYLESGIAHYKIGDAHPNRSGLQLFDMIIVKSGCLYIGEENEQWEIKEGEAITLLPDCYHYSVKPVNHETSFYWIHFQTVGSWQQTEQVTIKYPAETHQTCFNPMPYTIKIEKHTRLAYPKQAYQLLEQMNNTQHLLEPKAYRQKQQAFEALLYMLDVRQHQQQASQLVKLAEQVELYIRNHFKEAISNKRLADVFNYHYNYITRAMKSVYHCSPQQYMMKLRLDEAKILLLHSFDSIESIALTIGFENTPYFSNCFRKYVGMSPAQFRKTYNIQ